jgi:hypothetical protein
MLDLVALWREAVVVVQELMACSTRDGDFVRRPVCCDKDNGLWLLRCAELEDLRYSGLEGLCDLGVGWVSQKGY